MAYSETIHKCRCYSSPANKDTENRTHCRERGDVLDLSPIEAPSCDSLKRAYQRPYPQSLHRPTPGYLAPIHNGATSVGSRESFHPDACASSSRSLSPAPKCHCTARKHVMTCRELLQTEESYLASLSTITDVFMTQFERKNVVRTRDFRQLFPTQLEQLTSIHMAFFHHLSLHIAAGCYNRIGSLFIHLLTSTDVCLTDVYAAYMNSFQVSCETHKKYKYDSHFQQVYQDCLCNPACKGLDLFAHLLTPVQRLPRYKLILLDLIQTSPELNPQLQTALNILEAQLSALNCAITQATKYFLAPASMKMKLRRRLGKRSEFDDQWRCSSQTDVEGSTSHLSSFKSVDNLSSCGQSSPLHRASSAKLRTMYASNPILSIDSTSKNKKSKKIPKLFRKFFHK